MRHGSPVAILCAAWLLAAGCRPVDACAETGPVCGGDPIGVGQDTGAWIEADACQDPALVDSTIAKRAYRGQPAITAGQPPPEATTTDWCSDLVYGADGISFLMLPRDTPRIQGAYLTFQARAPGDPDHAKGLYAALVTSSDRTSIEYSRSCLERFGFSPDCVQFAQSFATYGAGLGGVKETSCEATAGAGCRCSYLIESDAAGTNLSGNWTADGGVMTLLAGNMVLPSRVDYCVQGDHMTLWGHNRTNILDFVGLRTMTLQKVVCGDGRTDRGEQCDPPDGTTCNSRCQMVAP
jgi:hypothetical protein